MITHSHKLLALSALILSSGGNIFAAADTTNDDATRNPFLVAAEKSPNKSQKAAWEHLNSIVTQGQLNTKGAKGDKGPAGIGFNKLQQFVNFDKANPKTGAAAMTGAAVIAYAALYAGEANDTIQEFAANGAKATLANFAVQTTLAAGRVLGKNTKIQGTLIVPAHMTVNYAAETLFTKTTEKWVNKFLELTYLKNTRVINTVASWIYAEDTYKSQAAKEALKIALAAAVARKMQA
jgi:hypothetical protein